MTMEIEGDHTLEKVRKLAAKGYSADAIRGIVGNSASSAIVRRIVAREKLSAQQKRKAERERWEEAIRVERQKERERARDAVALYREVPVRTDGRVTVRDVLLSVCDREGIPVKEMLSKSRIRRLADVRQEIMYLAACLTPASLPTIGHALHRDHTSVLHGIRKHAARNGLRLPRGMVFGKTARVVVRSCGQAVEMENSARQPSTEPS